VPPEQVTSLWKLRTKEEAQEFWEAEFGHLSRKGLRVDAEVSNSQENGHHYFVASHSKPSPALATVVAALSRESPSAEEARLRPNVVEQSAQKTPLSSAQEENLSAERL